VSNLPHLSLENPRTFQDLLLKFQGLDILQKEILDFPGGVETLPLVCTPYRGRSRPQIIVYNTWFNGSMSQLPNGILISSSIFVQLIEMPNTQTDIQTTLHATSAETGCTYAVRASNAV